MSAANDADGKSAPYVAPPSSTAVADPRVQFLSDAFQPGTIIGGTTQYAPQVANTTFFITLEMRVGMSSRCKKWSPKSLTQTLRSVADEVEAEFKIPIARFYVASAEKEISFYDGEAFQKTIAEIGLAPGDTLTFRNDLSPVSPIWDVGLMWDTEPDDYQAFCALLCTKKVLFKEVVVGERDVRLKAAATDCAFFLAQKEFPEAFPSAPKRSVVTATAVDEMGTMQAVTGTTEVASTLDKKTTTVTPIAVTSSSTSASVLSDGGKDGVSRAAIIGWMSRKSELVYRDELKPFDGLTLVSVVGTPIDWMACPDFDAGIAVDFWCERFHAFNASHPNPLLIALKPVHELVALAEKKTFSMDKTTLLFASNGFNIGAATERQPEKQQKLLRALAKFKRVVWFGSVPSIKNSRVPGGNSIETTRSEEYFKQLDKRYETSDLFRRLGKEAMQLWNTHISTEMLDLLRASYQTVACDAKHASFEEEQKAVFALLDGKDGVEQMKARKINTRDMERWKVAWATAKQPSQQTVAADQCTVAAFFDRGFDAYLHNRVAYFTDTGFIAYRPVADAEVSNLWVYEDIPLSDLVAALVALFS